MDEGYIKLNRKMLNWEWFPDSNTVHVFLYCLLNANWKQGEFHGVNIDRGQFATSLARMSNDTGLSIQNVRTALKHLESTGELTSKSQGKFRIISISNYCRYQDANKESNSELTSELTTIEEYKNKRNNNIPPLYPPLEGETPKEKPKKKSKEATNLEYLRQHLPNYSFSDRMVNILEEWMRYKGQRKDVYTEIGTKSFLTKISNCVRDYGEEKVVKVITDSMSSGYAGVVYDWLEKDNKLKERTGYVSYAERGLR